MKKILALFMVSVFCLTVVGCKEKNKEEPTPIDPTPPVIENTPEPEKEPAVFVPYVSEDWTEFKFNVNGKELTLPTSYTELSEASKTTLRQPIELESGSTKSLYVYDENDVSAFFVGFSNNTEEVADITNSSVYSINQSYPVVEMGAAPITFPGSLQVGMEHFPENPEEAGFKGKMEVIKTDEGKGVEDMTIKFSKINDDGSIDYNSYYEIKFVGKKISSLTLVCGK